MIKSKKSLKGASPLKNKILCVIIAIIICLSFSVPSYANELTGYFTPYDVTVTAESGAVLFDQVWNEDMTRSIMRPLAVFVPVGTHLTVTDEFEFEGTNYLAVEYRDYSAYIKQEKITINVQNAGEEVAFPTYSERSVIIINKDGVSLRNGPSFAYDVAGKTIPYGTTVNYNMTNCESEVYARWAYTEYEGVNGWLYIYQYDMNNNYDCAYVLDKDDRYTGSVITLTNGAFLTETPDSSSAKTVENIPEGTTFSFKYFYEHFDSISAYVEYNGTKGWLKAKNTSYKAATGEKGGVYILAEKGLPLYSKAFDESDKPIAIIPANTNLCVDYIYWDAGTNGEEILEYNWMHVNYNGTDGWIFSSDVSDYCYMQIAYDLKIEKADGLSLYSTPSINSEIISTVPNGTTVTCIYEIAETTDSEYFYWSYIEYNGKHGWICSKEEEAVFVEGTEKQLDAPFGAQPVKSDSGFDAPEIKAETKLSAFINNNKTAIVIVIAGAAVVIAAVITAVVVKKKKSK